MGRSARWFRARGADTNRGAGEAQVAESLPTLAQIERLVGEEVAEALAALLHHEADLRGIDP